MGFHYGHKKEGLRNPVDLGEEWKKIFLEMATAPRSHGSHASGKGSKEEKNPGSGARVQGRFMSFDDWGDYKKIRAKTRGGRGFRRCMIGKASLPILLNPASQKDEETFTAFGRGSDHYLQKKKGRMPVKGKSKQNQIGRELKKQKKRSGGIAGPSTFKKSAKKDRWVWPKEDWAETKTAFSRGNEERRQSKGRKGEGSRYTLATGVSIRIQRRLVIKRGKRKSRSLVNPIQTIRRSANKETKESNEQHRGYLDHFTLVRRRYLFFFKDRGKCSIKGRGHFTLRWGGPGEHIPILS